MATLYKNDSTKQTVNLVALIKTFMQSKFTCHPERYVEILRVVQKYKLYAMLSQLGLLRESEYVAHDIPADDGCAENFSHALEELGTCFIKLGQLLSTRSDLLPASFTTALTRLQDTVTPVPGECIAEIIERELGAPLTDLFQSIDWEPLATASVAQVHKAVLHDGSHVIIKVQRPGVQQQVETDIDVMQEVCRFLTRYTPFGTRYGLMQLAQELKQSLSQELDFQQEASNTQLVGHYLRDFQHLMTPTVYSDYTSRRVLTLSFVPGRHLAKLSSAELRNGGGSAIAQDLLSAYLKQIVVDGIFHCDPHPGNILLCDDGRLALLDFGMVGRFDAGQKENVILLLLAFSERQGERVADTYLEMVDAPETFDRMAFTQEICSLVSRYHDMSKGRMEIGRALLDMVALAQSYRAPIPTSLSLLGKAMLNLDGTLRVLSSDLDPVQVIRNYMAQVMQEQAFAQLSPVRSYTWLLDAKHLTENIPHRTDLISDKLAHDRLTFRLKTDSLDKMLQQVTQRLSWSMLLSSLMISAGVFFAPRWRRNRS